MNDHLKMVIAVLVFAIGLGFANISSYRNSIQEFSKELSKDKEQSKPVVKKLISCSTVTFVTIEKKHEKLIAQSKVIKVNKPVIMKKRAKISTKIPSVKDDNEEDNAITIYAVFDNVETTQLLLEVSPDVSISHSEILKQMQRLRV